MQQQEEPQEAMPLVLALLKPPLLLQLPEAAALEVLLLEELPMPLQVLVRDISLLVDTSSARARMVDGCLDLTGVDKAEQAVLMESIQAIRRTSQSATRETAVAAAMPTPGKRKRGP